MTDRKKNRKKNPVFIVIIIACVAVMAFAAYKLISLQLEYRAGRDEYTGLRQYTFSRAAADEEESEASGEARDEADMAGAPIVPHMKCPIDVDFDALKEINGDIVGWVYVGAAEISYPVVKGADNDEYLHRTFLGTDNFAGSIFMESANTADFSDPHTILYGHNMKDQSMFGRLHLLSEEEKYEDDPYIWVLTPEHTYRYSMFSLHTVRYDGPVYMLFSGPSALVSDYIAQCAADSEVPLEIPPYGEESRVLTLSTCTDNETERYAAQGILDQVD